MISKKTNTKRVKIEKPAKTSGKSLGFKNRGTIWSRIKKSSKNFSRVFKNRVKNWLGKFANSIGIQFDGNLYGDLGKFLDLRRITLREEIIAKEKITE